MKCEWEHVINMMFNACQMKVIFTVKLLFGKGIYIDIYTTHVHLNLIDNSKTQYTQHNYNTTYIMHPTYQNSSIQLHI